MKHRILAIVCSIATAFTASAQVPSLINYQGRLTDSNGAPVTGSKNFAISIYDAATGGNLLYEETIGAVTLDANGVYSFQFGSAGSSSTQVTETIGTTDGTTLTYSKALSNTPVVNNSITVTDGTNSWSQSVGNPGVGATATATTISGFVIGATITNGGSGYTSAPSVTITGSGTGATGTATISGGVVTAINITSAGSGYAGGATITIAPPVIPFRVDYSGGTITATYSSAPTAGQTISATYRYTTSGIAGALGAGAEHWMAVSVDGVVQATRQRVLAVPFAQFSEKANNGIDMSFGYKILELDTPFLVPADGYIYVESGPAWQFDPWSSIRYSTASLKIAKSQQEITTSPTFNVYEANGKVQLPVPKGYWIFASAPSVGSGAGKAYYIRMSK